LYERRSYLTEVYRNALSREVRALGYEIENRRDVAGKDMGFEIAGVSQEILDNYSRRSAQRDAAIHEFTHKRGRAPTDNDVAVLIRETRADKLQEISTEQLRCRQFERLTPDQRNTLGSLREEALKQSSPLRIEHRGAQASLGHSQKHIFERLSVAKEHEILTEALRHGRGEVELSALQGLLSRERTSGNLVFCIFNVFTNNREQCILAICLFHPRPNCLSPFRIASGYWKSAVIAAHPEELFCASTLLWRRRFNSD
jgi:TrwC relaxase